MAITLSRRDEILQRHSQMYQNSMPAYSKFFRYIRTVVEGRGGAEDENAILEALRILSPITPGQELSGVAALNHTGYRQKYLEIIK